MPWSSKRSVSVRYVADLFDCSDDSIQRLIRSGVLKAYRLRGNNSPWRIYYDSVVAYAKKLADEAGVEIRFEL
jgi:excisionase family DNA binding protein